MENISTFEITEQNEILTYVLIDKGNGEFVTMLKTDYDNMKVQQFAPMFEITTEQPTEQTQEGAE